MHVGYVSPQFPAGLSANGVSSYTEIMAEQMASQGHSVSVFCLTAAHHTRVVEPGCDGYLRVYSVTRRGPWVPLVGTLYARLGRRVLPGYFQARDVGVGLCEAVNRVHREHPIDLLECPESRGIPSWVQSLDFPVVVRLHAPRAVTARANGERPSWVLRGIARTERRCLKNARFLSAPSRAVVVETEKVLDLKLSDVCVIPNPVGVRRHNVEQNDQAPTREVLFVGRIDLLKGFDVLIEAFKLLATKPGFRDVKLRIVGPNQGLHLNRTTILPGAEYVRRSVQDDDVRARINLVGPLSYQEVQMQRRPGIITVIPSRFESFGIVVIEAMAAGCPVVASDAGGIPEIIQHERNGLLFHSGNWRELADQLERLLNDKSLRLRLGLQAQADVRARYNPDLVAEQTEQFYREVIEQHERHH